MLYAPAKWPGHSLTFTPKTGMSLIDRSAPAAPDRLAAFVRRSLTLGDVVVIGEVGNLQDLRMVGDILIEHPFENFVVGNIQQSVADERVFDGVKRPMIRILHQQPYFLHGIEFCAKIGKNRNKTHLFHAHP